MPIHPVLSEYQARLQALQAGLAQARVQHSAAAALLAMAMALFLALGFYAIRQRVPVWWPSLPIPIAAASARQYRRRRLAQSRMWRLQHFYERGLLRLKGMWAGEGDPGDEFNSAGHEYARDLGLFGVGSLFERLCTVRTAAGRRGLAQYLLQAPALGETLVRQEAVRELQPLTGLREEAAALGEFWFSESKVETVSDWLDSPMIPFPKWLPRAATITSALCAGILLAGLLTVVPWIRVAIWISPLVAFHMAVGLVHRDQVNRIIRAVSPVSLETRVLKQGLELLERQQFQSAKLREIVERVQGGSRSVRKLERWLEALGQRNKEWFYLPSLLLLGGTQLCMAVERWRKQERAALRGWLEAWGEFEALNALANYARENPDHAFPEFADGEARFEALALGHPLLPAEECVRNDVELNQGRRFYVVSGSNMSGKSTLLRAMGLNTVLAFAGAPVRAASLQLSALSLYASLSVVDFLLNGKSKFQAEVDRLRQTIDAATSGKPVLFLIDEIFSGTNSSDRRVAAEAVVRTLVELGAVGALSTHDLALTEIAEAEGLGGTNVHMGSREGGDPMDFDFRLKPGVSTETNALAIARMAGVPV